MLFATSCQNDLDLGIETGEEALVSFNVTTPDMATRAYGEGLMATNLQYAVYNEAGEALDSYTVTQKEIYGSTTVNLKLLTGDTYSIIFWASAPNAPYTLDFENQTMTVNYNGAMSNDEARDAFFAYVEPFTVSGTQAIDVDLTRPFAQLNIGTNDYEDADNVGFVPTHSTVTVKNVYSTLNLATGVVGGEKSVTFANAEIKKDEVFPVAGNEYLAMNYLLVGTDKETVNVEFTCTDGTKSKTRKVGSVPVQRNYRTNIYGSILTSDVDVNVEIKPGFEQPAYSVKSADELVTAINDAIANNTDATIELDENISLNETLTFTVATRSGAATQGPSFVIDGKGKTIYYGGNNRAIDVTNQLERANLTLKDVTIECLSDYCQRGINYNTNGKLTLDGVTVKGKNVTYALNLPGSSIDAVVTIKESNLTGNIALNVWGKNAKIDATDSHFTSVDNVSAENYTAIALNNDGTTSAEDAVVNINGGTITAKDENGEPSYAVRNSTATGVVNVSEETKVIGKIVNPVAIVTYEGYNEFYSCSTLQNAIDKAIETNGSVKLISDIELSEPIIIADGASLTLNLNGKTITGTMSKSVGHVVKNYATLTIKNGTISSAGANGGSALYNKGNLTVENATINGSSIRENGGWPSYPINNYSDRDMTLKNVTITGYQGAVACNAAGTTTLDNCTINKEYLNTSSHVFYIDNAGAKVIVNGGTYTHKGMDGSLAYVNKGEIIVNDGTFNTEGGGYGIAALTNGKVTVNGGTFNADLINWGGSITITGGYFKADPTKHLVEGYKAIKANGVFMVVANDVNGYCDYVIEDKEGCRYEGDVFESGYMDNALWFNNWIFDGDAAIVVEDKTYNAIVIENCVGNFKNDVITINNDNSSVMILQNLDFTLAEGEKLIKSVKPIYQVFMSNITINGEKMTQETIAQYLENVAWYQVVEEI